MSMSIDPVRRLPKGSTNARRSLFRYDDLLPEESDAMQKALKRLPPKEAYDRVFRLRRAFQASLAHQLLPKEQQTTPEEDKPYLLPILEEIEAAEKERDDLESMVIKKR
ncbi:MAG: Cytochrome b-c1 complex subunit 7 [Piccolia ochrophora]|nr:MAG: Cytochrome b-c1 complex subunit 7 [Piccolia ochrophora]